MALSIMYPTVCVVNSSTLHGCLIVHEFSQLFVERIEEMECQGDTWALYSILFSLRATNGIVKFMKMY